ncbi:hypothetical protein LSCM1_04802 [Leishmania martiniquensis]|uniref:Transmembrane protein n=1 Tax=Leishmania martiniquensis TaxID=1580590 RepID=A0A836HMX2_9TRYP|nr:hypothetical protein LSCM1_04802 [Leishmania martiniquensis]
MEFFQVVDPVTLAPLPYTHVALELAVSVVCAVLLGVCLHVLPGRLVHRSKAASLKVPREALAEVTAPASGRTAPKKLPTSVSLDPSPSATASKAPTKTDQAPSAAVADSTLDSALESFFEEESLLKEALVDTAVPSALPEDGTRPAGQARMQIAQSSPKESSEFSKELAAKMTKGLQRKARPASAAPPPMTAPIPPVKKETADKKLEDALDAYMAEEELLNEVMLDSALAAAHRAAYSTA